VFLFLWAGVAVSSAFPEDEGRERDAELLGRQKVLIVILQTIFSGVILCLAYGVGYISRSLSTMIDAFCSSIVATKSPQEVAHIWNMTQAVLRKASISVEHCLLVLCMILAMMVPLTLIDGAFGARSAPLPTLLPGILIICGILYVFLLAAAISEQCTRVPALINAICFGEGTEVARQQTVDYIRSSAAGFYVFGMRLTLVMVVKFMYLWCIVVVSMMTRLGDDLA